MVERSSSPLRSLVKSAADKSLRRFGYEIRKCRETRPWHPPEATEHEKQIVEKFAPYTMTGRWRQWSLLKAVDYVDAHQIPGAIVECGVWRGGGMMMVKDFRSGREARDIYLYDTFAGMSEPTPDDISPSGAAANVKYNALRRDAFTDWALSPLDEVVANFERFDLMGPDIHIRQGKVEETLRSLPLPASIALLRLDTDWYESTKVEMEVLYPLLSPGGVLIVDDYGDWLGSAKAVNEHLGDQSPFLIPIDHGCRVTIK